MHNFYLFIYFHFEIDYLPSINYPELGDCSLMKIWNLNKITGVLGIFNCQRGGIWPPIRGAPYNPPSESEPFVISGTVSPRDVEFLGMVAGEDWLGDCTVYLYTTGSTYKLSSRYC